MRHPVLAGEIRSQVPLPSISALQPVRRLRERQLATVLRYASTIT